MKTKLHLKVWNATALVFILLIFPLFSGESATFSIALDDFITKRYESLDPGDGVKPPRDLYERGMIGYFNLKAEGKEITNEKLTLIDFRLSSTRKRMWVIDLNTNKLLYYRLVAHGKNTGGEYARSFSNIRYSNKSSLGFYITGENYTGKHGLSLRLDGMEPGFNDLARQRAVVMHGAAYVSTDFIKLYGRLGRSFGCPAIAMKNHKEIIKMLANKSLLFIYSPELEYEEKTLLNDREKAQRYLQYAKLTASSEAAAP